MKTTLDPERTVVFDSNSRLEEYQTFVESHANSTVFHHRRWIELLQKQYGFDLRLPCLKRDGLIVAAIPFLATVRLRGQRKLVSLPFTDSLDILGCPDDIQLLKENIRDSLIGGPFDSACVRCSVAEENGSESDSIWVRHVIDTTKSIAELERAFDRRVRTNLRRAESSNLTFSVEHTKDAIEEFYQLQVRTRHRLGVPVQQKRFFESLRNSFFDNDMGFVGVVRHDNEAIAAGLFLHYQGTMVYKYSASAEAKTSLRPNELLTYEALKWAAEHGIREFDFGISKRSQTGLRRFKRKFGASEFSVNRNFIIGQAGTEPEDSLAMKVASWLIRTSPAFVCRGLGAMFYRYSP